MYNNVHVLWGGVKKNGRIAVSLVSFSLFIFVAFPTRLIVLISRVNEREGVSEGVRE